MPRTAIDNILKDTEMFLNLAMEETMSPSRAASILGVFDDATKEEIHKAYAKELNRIMGRPFASQKREQIESAFQTMMGKAKGEHKSYIPIPGKNVVKLDAEDAAKGAVSLYERDPNFIEYFVELEKSKWSWFDITKYVQRHDEDLANQILEGYAIAREHSLVAEYRQWLCDAVKRIMYQKISHKIHQQQMSLNDCADQNYA